MTNQWFLEDIEQLIKRRGRVVILDPRSQYAFFVIIGVPGICPAQD